MTKRTSPLLAAILLAAAPARPQTSAPAPAAPPAPAPPPVIAPADNLVVEGVPAIPAELAERIGAYSEFRRAAFRSWHPTKREMLIMTRFGDTYQVHHLAA